MLYQKIETLYDRDQKTRLIIDGTSKINNYFDTDSDRINNFLLTEKVDGTNICIGYKIGKTGEGYITINGRNHESQIHPKLIGYINDRMTYGMMRKLFYSEETFIYGEAYGKLINPECGYNCDLEFLVFDILNCNKWLTRSEVVVASSVLNMNSVPEIKDGVILGTDLVRNGFKSLIPGEENVWAEGIIIKHKGNAYDKNLYDENGDRRIYKLKTSDFLGKKWKKLL